MHEPDEGSDTRSPSADAEAPGAERAHAALKLFALRTGLHQVVWHFDKVERLISEDVDRTDRASVADEPVAHAYNAANAVLRACGYVMEAYYIISGGGKPPRRLDDYKPLLRERGLDPGGAEWQTLTQAFKVRHCLLHANGRVSLMEAKQAGRLRRLISDLPEALELRHDRIRVKRPFVVDVANAAHWMISRVQLP